MSWTALRRSSAPDHRAHDLGRRLHDRVLRVAAGQRLPARASAVGAEARASLAPPARRMSTWFFAGLVVGLDDGAGRRLLHRGADAVDLGRVLELHDELRAAGELDAVALGVLPR